MLGYLALAVALLFGCLAAWKGARRSSIPLLASALLATGFCFLGVPFNFYFWLMIDLAVIVVIWHDEMSYKDMAIVVLFFPAWLNYALTGNEPDFWISWGIVMAQFGLTFPLEQVARVARRLIHSRKHNHRDLLVAA